MGSVSTTQLGEDNKYMYFTAKTQDFPPFVITGKTVNGTETQPSTENKTHLAMDNTQNESTS
ncbi:PGF-pre-PGF domain-containing protein [Methanosarcina sp. DH2]|jgi:hypothetical protein|uniref:PGF-pre-PGF domain-containing protein n=1 Tax=Methanosarcina sp. DH2 TaxID=2605639 RepID=UPI00210437FD|nr:PGF-pre-PGF domain-containing protein [Methanosarcina sp. DH2]